MDRYNNPNPFQEESCQKLALYLKDKINKLSSELFNITVIKSTRTYDAFNVPNQEYPLLIVFRNSELFEVSKNKKTSNIIIRYCLLLPDMEKILPLSTWVANEIHTSLNQFYAHNSCIQLVPQNRQVEYKVSDTQSSSFIYHFMNYYFSLRE